MVIEKFLKKLKINPGAPKDLIDSVEQKIGVKFPADYKKFLLMSNGVSGFVGKSYLLIWALEEIVEINQQASVNEFAPGLILFGSDGGGMSYALDTRDPIFSIVEVPNIGMSLDEVKFCGSSLHEFLVYLLNKEWIS